MKKTTRIIAMLLVILLAFPTVNVRAEEMSAEPEEETTVGNTNSDTDEYKNVNVIFEDNKGNVVTSFVKDIPKETTLGELLGEEYPVLPADPVLGEFKGWWIYAGNEEKAYTKDDAFILPTDFTADSIYFSPVYQKQYVWLTEVYLTEKGWVMDEKRLVFDIGTPEADIRALLPTPADVGTSCHFTGWGRDDNLEKVGYYECSFWYTAEYDNYPIIINKTYIDQNGNLKSCKEKKYYPKGTKYEDILPEYQNVPEDASTQYTITGWNMFDENGAIQTTGEIGYNGYNFYYEDYTFNPGIGRENENGVNYFEMVAAYDDKVIEGIDYTYINSERKIEKNRKFILCDEGENLDSIKAKAMEYAPDDHYEALAYQGDWKISKRKAVNSETQCYVMTPSYGKVVVHIHKRDKEGVETCQAYAAEEGDVIKCPKGYDMQIYITNAGGGDIYDSYVITEGTEVIEFWYLWNDSIIDDYDTMIEDIQNAGDGATVSAELESGVLEKSVLENLKGKDVSLLVSVKNETTEAKWNIAGLNIPNGTFSDIDFSVTKKDKNSGNVDADTINELAGSRSVEQLVFGVNENLPFKPQFTLGIDSANVTEKGVLLQKEGDSLMLTDNAMIQDGTVTFNLEQKADSVVVYGMNGDTDGDDKVRIKDAMQILQQTSSRKAMNEVQKGFADTDSNNKINLQDVMREMHYISGRSTVVY